MQFENWGLIPYAEALSRQELLVDEVSCGRRESTVILCSHPPIVTLGRATQPGDVFSWTGESMPVSRGGRATYHGPSQLVVYPVIALDSMKSGRDIGLYLRSFENILIRSLSAFSISASGNRSSRPEDTGLWVDHHGARRKIASLGVAVRKWTSYHGAAINIEHDPSAFKGLNPCGFQSSTMISAEEILGHKISRLELEAKIKIEMQLGWAQDIERFLNSDDIAEKSPAPS